jgi:hypothetical protein
MKKILPVVVLKQAGALYARAQVYNGDLIFTGFTGFLNIKDESDFTICNNAALTTLDGLNNFNSTCKKQLF